MKLIVGLERPLIPLLSLSLKSEKEEQGESEMCYEKRLNGNRGTAEIDTDMKKRSLQDEVRIPIMMILLFSHSLMPRPPTLMQLSLSLTCCFLSCHSWSKKCTKIKKASSTAIQSKVRSSYVVNRQICCWFGRTLHAWFNVHAQQRCSKWLSATTTPNIC